MICLVSYRTFLWSFGRLGPGFLFTCTYRDILFGWHALDDIYLEYNGHFLCICFWF